MAWDVHGRGSAWDRGLHGRGRMCGRGHAWQGGACMA